MHAYRPGHGAARTRVLYVFHSPSNIKVGRRALEPEVMEALEHTHPDLTFDWTTLLRDPAARIEPYETPGPGRSGNGAAPSRPRPSPEAAPAPPIEIDDQSVLGRALGGREAARLRSRYNDLLQRILRRARTPEERDRLTERATRLNPDDWADAAAVQAAVTSVEAAWDAVASELPARRRGRRGGRSGARRAEAERLPQASAGVSPGDRGGSPEGDFGPDEGLAPGPDESELSGIITEEGDTNEDAVQDFQARDTGQNSGAGDTGDGGGLGADSGPAADPADSSASAGDEPSDEGGLPGGS
jgi:hypothetical protein